MSLKPSADAGTRPAAPARKPDRKNSWTVDGWITLARFLRRYDSPLGRAARRTGGSVRRKAARWRT
jgi:hypothetical protein